MTFTMGLEFHEVFSLSLGDESRDMWRLPRRASFDTALSDCRDRDQKMIVGLLF